MKVLITVRVNEYGNIVKSIEGRQKHIVKEFESEKELEEYLKTHSVISVMILEREKDERNKNGRPESNST